MSRVAGTGRHLLAACLLVAVTAVSACQNGDTTDRTPPTATPAPSTNVEQNSAAVCVLVSAPVSGVTSTADLGQLSTGQISRQEFGERLRARFRTAATRLRQLAPEAVDPTLRAAIERWAGVLDEGASAPDVFAFYMGQYHAVVDEFNVTCKRGESQGARSSPTESAN